MSNDALKKAERLLAKQKRREEAAAAKATSARGGTAPPANQNSDPLSAGKDALKTAQEFNENMNWFREHFDKAKGVAVEYGQKAKRVLGPIWDKALRPTVGWAGKKYMEIFNKYSFTKDHEGKRIVNAKGMATTITMTALAGMLAWNAGPAMIGFGVDMSYDAAMALTTREKEIYLVGSNTIEEGSLYTAKGCWDLPATEDNTTQFHIRRNLIQGIWHPEKLYAAIPEETSKATIKYYGFRFRPLGLYPHLVSVKATPLSQLSAKDSALHNTNQPVQVDPAPAPALTP